MGNQEEDRLKTLYEKGLTYKEIASELECSPRTVGRKLKKYGIKRNRKTHSQADEIGESKLDSLYREKGLSLTDISDIYDVEPSTVSDWLDRFEIETRQSPADITYAPFTHHRDGYEIWKTLSGGKHRRVRVHRLQAVAEYGFESVSGMDIHHKNGIPWDNRPENIQPVSKKTHLEIHKLEWKEKQLQAVSDSSSGEGNTNAKIDESDVEEIRKRYQDETANEIKQDFDLSEEHIRRIATGESWSHIDKGLE